MAKRQIREHVLARLAPAVFDVLGEPLVEPGQGVLPRAAFLAGADLARGPAQPEALPEALVVLLGHAEQVGHHQHGERLGVGGDELAPAVAEELVKLLVGQSPHERLVVLQPLGGDQPHQQAPLPGVVGGVHGDHVLVHRQLVPVAIDDGADVVALQGDREGGERADDRVARREGLVVPVHIGGLVVPGHRHHPEVGQRQDRAFGAERLEVGVGVLDQRLVEEEVGRPPVAQALVSFMRCCAPAQQSCATA